MSALDLLLVALATWRLSYMIARESGPFGFFEQMRQRLPLGGLTTCMYCLSVWVAVLMLIVWQSTVQIVVVALSISAAALMLGSYTGANHPG